MHTAIVYTFTVVPFSSSLPLRERESCRFAFQKQIQSTLSPLFFSTHMSGLILPQWPSAYLRPEALHSDPVLF